MKIKVFLFFVTVLFVVNFQATAQESTTTLLEKAQIIAKKEGKSIFVKFEASWCGWCHVLTKNMKAKRTKKFFEDNFVTVPIVVFESPNKKKLENPGSEALIKKYKGEKAGLPFWVILDSDLKVMTTSFDSRGQNLGGASSKLEVRRFIKKLKKSVTIFTKADAANIKKQFLQKR
jgi:thioredoxin-related protein